MTAQRASQHYTPLTGRRILSMLIGFFGFIIVVNGVFIYFALESWPGLSTDDAYRKGLAYNETLNAAQQQHALGWHSDIAFISRENITGVLRVQLKNAQNSGLAGLDVLVRLARPTREEFDRTITLTPISDGLYRAPVTLPLKGRWHATVEARINGKLKYLMKHALMVK